MREKIENIIALLVVALSLAAGCGLLYLLIIGTGKLVEIILEVL